LCLPDWDDRPAWHPVVRRLLACVDPDDDTTIVLRSDAAAGYPASRVVAELEALLATLPSSGELPDVLVTEDGLGGEPVDRLFASVQAYVPAGERLEDRHRALAEATGVPLVEVRPEVV
jgi:hypothetical protein